MIFIIDNVSYRYGFEIIENKVNTEWLFVKEPTSQKESYCFKREYGVVQINSRTFKVSKSLESIARGNALFLSSVSQFNVPMALDIRNWFNRSFNIKTLRCLHLAKSNTKQYNRKHSEGKQIDTEPKFP